MNPNFERLNISPFGYVRKETTNVNTSMLSEKQFARKIGHKKRVKIFWSSLFHGDKAKRYHSSSNCEGSGAVQLFLFIFACHDVY